MKNPKPPTEKRDWLVMIYIAANDINPNELDPRGSIDTACKSMMDNLRTMKDTQNIYITVLFDGNEPQESAKIRWLNTKETGGSWIDMIDELANDDNFKDIIQGVFGHRALDSGYHKTLQYFITWSLNTFNANNTMLSIIGHGGGWSPTTQKGSGGGEAGFVTNGLCPDYTSRSEITTRELREAIEKPLHKIEAEGAKKDEAKIDVVFLDVCLSGMIEIAYELHNVARYLVAGQDLLYAGFPYDLYLDGLNAETCPKTLAQNIVEKYNPPERYPYQGCWAISAIDLDVLSRKVVPQVRLLADYLRDLIDLFEGDNQMANKPDIRSIIAQAYRSTQKYNYDADGKIDSEREAYIDLFHFAYQLTIFLGVLTINDVDCNIRSQANCVIKEAGQLMSLIGETTRSVSRVNEEGCVLTYGKPIPLLNSSIKNLSENAIVCMRTQSRDSVSNYSLEYAFGLSIYVPLGEEEVRTQDSNDKSYERGKALEFYTDVNHLLFATGCATWGKLLKKLYRVKVAPITPLTRPLPPVYEVTKRLMTGSPRYRMPRQQ